MKEYKLPIGCDVPETIILADGDCWRWRFFIAGY